MVNARTYKYIGLIITLVIPVLTSVVFAGSHKYSVGHTGSVLHYLSGELFYWSLFILLFLVAKYGEKEPILFLNPRANPTITFGTGILIFFSLVATGIVYRLIYHVVLRLASPHEAIMDQLLQFPGWFKVMLAIRAGIIEETFYRAYAMSRLMQLTNNRFVAFFIPLLFFALSHYSYGTVNHVAGALALGITLAVWYLKTKNLVANMIGHSLLDMFGLLFGRA